MSKPATEPAAPAPVFMRVDFAVSGLALVLYLLTAARTVTLVDSGELIVSAATLGVAHPPGFPVYTLVAWLFTKLPIGTIAFRVALLSAVSASVACALASATTRALLGLPGRPAAATRKHAKAAPATVPWWMRDTPSFVSGVALATSATVWFYATVAEVYTLHLALLLGTTLSLFKWRSWRAVDGALADRRLILPAVLFGLALGVHHVTAVLVAPGLLVLVLAVAGGSIWRSRRWWWAVVASVATTVLAYSYLPLAARSNAVLAWGDPRTWTTFWWHISGKWYQENLFSTTLDQMTKNFATFVATAWHQFGPLGLLPALGALWLWRRDRGVAVAALVMVLCDVVYGIKYEIAEDTDAYFLPTFAIMAVGLGLGLAWLLERWPRARLLAPVAVAATLALVPNHWRACDRHADGIAHDFVTDALAGVGERGLLLTLDWQLYSPYLYLRHIERVREDATVVDVNLMRRSWYLERYLPATYPEMMAACREPSLAFVSKLRDWEAGKSPDPAELTRRFTALIDAMIAFHLDRGRDAHVTIPMEPGVGAGLSWVPDGLTMRLSRKPVSAPPRPRALHTEALAVEPTLDAVARGKVRPYYARMLALRARYLASLGQRTAAVDALRQAEELEPSAAEVQRVRQEIGG